MQKQIIASKLVNDVMRETEWQKRTYGSSFKQYAANKSWQESTGNKPQLTRQHDFSQKSLDTLCFFLTVPLTSSAYIKMRRWWVSRRMKVPRLTHKHKCTVGGFVGRQAAITWCHLEQRTEYLSRDVGGPAMCYHTLLLNNTTASFDPYPHTVRQHWQRKLASL